MARLIKVPIAWEDESDGTIFFRAPRGSRAVQYQSAVPDTAGERLSPTEAQHYYAESLAMCVEHYEGGDGVCSPYGEPFSWPKSDDAGAIARLFSEDITTSMVYELAAYVAVIRQVDGAKLGKSVHGRLSSLRQATSAASAQTPPG